MSNTDSNGAKDGRRTSHEESATAKEIREWSEENDEPHPVFEVPHRPERKNLNTEKRLKALADEIRSWADQHGSDLSAMSETEKTRVASYHRCAQEIERLIDTGENHE